jgi:mannose-1-phosphate guanylyltransferase/mannose-6-phosphate isomerase
MAQMQKLIPIVAAGGSGTRLWPLSREMHPKQFLNLGASHSLLQQTLQRVSVQDSGPVLDRPVIVSNENHAFLIQEQAAEIGADPRLIVLEPAGRNTAPALTAAALLLDGTDPVMAMLPADHFIDDNAAFLRCLDAARAAAESGAIVTIGVVPTRAETGYGYIRAAATGSDRESVMPVLRFVEKPDAATAAEFLRSGEYLWNSGVFVLRKSVWLRAIEKYRPDIHAAAAAAVDSGIGSDPFFRLGRPAFQNCPAESVDYAVMEPASGDPEFRCAVAPFDGGWSDMGSWQAIWEDQCRDSNGNLLSGDVFADNTRSSLIMSEGRLIAAVGCDNVVIAETADAVLVAGMDAAQSVSGLVQALKSRKREEAVSHRRVFRPWGSYESIARGTNYQVKRLHLPPGRRLSLQLHHRRSEHWIIVAGTATVVRGDETLLLKENESVHIPKETRHRLGNDTDAPLEVIEVQTGDYLGEDDIVRFDDDFGRNEEVHRLQGG